MGIISIPTTRRMRGALVYAPRGLFFRIVVLFFNSEKTKGKGEGQWVGCQNRKGKDCKRGEKGKGKKCEESTEERWKRSGEDVGNTFRNWEEKE